VKAAFKRSPTVVLLTDGQTADDLPPEVRMAADRVRTRDISALRTGKAPKGADGAIVWLAGERMLAGSGAAFRRELLTPGRRVLVPVHFPCLPEMDLIAVQPRCFSGGAGRECWNLDLRVGAAPRTSSEFRASLEKNRQPWARLTVALVEEQQSPGRGIEALARSWQSGCLPPLLAALVLRNLIILFARHERLDEAEELLALGMKAFPTYAELSFLAAVLRFRQGEPSKAVAYLERALNGENRAFVGSGGESSYRAGWLMGVLAAHAGNQRLAFQYWHQGLVNRPAFAPAVEELLNLRVSAELVERLQWELCGLARREPQYLEPVFDYLLLHRAFAACRRLLATLSLSEEVRTLLQEKLEAACAPFQPSAERKAARPGVMLTGPFLEHSSLGRINREIGVALLAAADLDACLEPSSHAALSPREISNADLLLRGFLHHPERLDLSIRHRWPPDFRRPPRGKLAVIVPWEYGAVPRKWVAEIERNVDELWVPSAFVREAFIRSGVRQEHVGVVPCGIDTDCFTPRGPAWRPPGTRSFIFLFVGGPIRRKGIDLLLEAYGAAFNAGDDVSLVVLAIGTNSFYQHNTLEDQLLDFCANSNSPHLVLMSEKLDDATLAKLYRGCDAFVLPYRGEGFGMPLAEALACGKPVITTELGPAKEFCPPEGTYFIPATIAPVPEQPPPLGEMAGAFTWFEPELDALVSIMRHVFDHREEAARRGLAAPEKVRAALDWSRITSLYLQRIRKLVGCPEGVGRTAVASRAELRTPCHP